MRLVKILVMTITIPSNLPVGFQKCGSVTLCEPFSCWGPHRVRVRVRFT